jgi:hypothetical protein
MYMGEKAKFDFATVLSDDRRVRIIEGEEFIFN